MPAPDEAAKSAAAQAPDEAAKSAAAPAPDEAAKSAAAPVPDEAARPDAPLDPEELARRSEAEFLTALYEGGAEAGDEGEAGDEDEDEGRRRAFERSLEALLPTSPEEVKRYRLRVDEREEAMADPGPAAMRSRTERVRLEPGFRPPLVELTPNLVTALVFTDSTGAAWPVESMVLGSGALFSAQLLEGQPANRIVVSPLTNHGHSNLVVSLKGRDIPLMTRLATSSAARPDRELDGLIIFQIQAHGPMAGPEALAGPETGGPVDEILYSILDGVVPPEGETVEAEPALEGESFVKVGGSVYLRTLRALLWPAPRARASGPGGLTVYEFEAAPSVMLSSREEVATVLLKGVDSGRVEALEARP
jgi:hypothetical protein